MITPNFATVKFKSLDPRAQAPTRAHDDDAGNDLRALEDVYLRPGATVPIKTGISVALPTYTYGQIADRSSMALKGFRVAGGVIDASFRGELSVMLQNTTTETQKIEAGQKVAQLIVLPIVEVTWEPAADLDQTARGTGGFGSSDK